VRGPQMRAGRGRARHTEPMQRLLVVLPLAVCAACAAAGAQRPRVERADQLPSHRYPLSGSAGDLVVDAAAFAKLAAPLRADMESDLARFDIREPESLKDRLFVLALLDALDDRWPAALARIDQIAAVETKPANKAMTGLTIRIWTDAIAHGGDLDAFRAALERKLATMPIDLVRDDLSTLRTMAQVFTPDVCRQLVESEIGRHIANGALSLEQAQAIAFQRYAVVRLVPVARAIDTALGALGIEPKAVE
jgi:hypothetical protein